MLKTSAQLISFVLHPLMVPTYMLIILMLVNPFAFSVSSIGDMSSRLLLIRLFLSTFFIPVFAVMMLRFLGLVKSIELKDQDERIGPYIITGIFYLWMFRNFLSDSQIPTIYASFLLGATIALFVAFFINIFSKISAHTVGMGGLLAMVLITWMTYFDYQAFVVDLPLLGRYQISLFALFVSTIFLSGMVGTARLALNAHDQQDVYGGYLIGFAAQLIAYRILIF